MRAPQSELRDGFVPWPHRSPFLDRVGPLAVSLTDRNVAGVLVAEHHANARGHLHGGAVAAILDPVMGHAIAGVRDPPAVLVTVSLTVNLVAAVEVGQWLTITAQPRRLGRRMAFADAIVEREDRVVATASGVFAVAGTQPA